MKQDVSMESPKLPYTKPTLTKQKPLRDITAGVIGSTVIIEPPG